MKKSTFDGIAGKKIRAFFLTGTVLFMVTNTINASWEQCSGIPTTSRCLAMYTTKNSIIVSVDYTQYLFRSTDEGLNWTSFNTAPDTLHPRFSTFTWNGKSLYAGSTNKGVCLSTDSGTSWTPINGSNGKSLNNFIINSIIICGDTIFAATMSNGVFRTTDNGSSWNQVNGGLPVSSTVWSLAVYKETLFASVDKHGVYRSSDCGKTWTQITNGLNTTIANAFLEKGDTLFLGSNNIYYSIDIGRTWRSTNTSFSNGCEVVSFAISRGLLFAATTCGVYLSQNHGSTWKSVNDTLSNTLINNILVTSNSVFIGTSNRGLLKRPLSEMINVAKLDLKQTYTNPGNFYDLKITGSSSFTLSLNINGIPLPQISLHSQSNTISTLNTIQYLEHETGKKVNFNDILTFYVYGQSSNGEIVTVSNFATIPYGLYISSQPARKTYNNQDIRITNSIIDCSSEKEKVQISMYSLTGKKVWAKQVSGEKTTLPNH
ncbi:MAG: hypothetical protein GX639_19005, partial [Fibrobacter sp.]|nr:hypothetical protein [Fibrobacter sp.]